MIYSSQFQTDCIKIVEVDKMASWQNDAAPFQSRVKGSIMTDLFLPVIIATLSMEQHIFKNVSDYRGRHWKSIIVYDL